MGSDETPLDQAERHIREAKEHIAKQEALISELVRDGHSKQAERGRKVLATFRQTLRTAQRHRRLLLEKEITTTRRRKPRTEGSGDPEGER